MPTITVNKKEFEKLVGKTFPLEELKDRISMLGTDLEKIENNEITVEIFPNRPDMLSDQGFARAFSSFMGINTGLKKYKINNSNYEVIVDSSVDKVRPFTACAVIKNLKLDDEKIREIIQIQEKLHVTYGRNRKKAAIGIYPLDKISFPITFKADKPNNISFIPLESAEKMSGLEILSKHKAGRDYAHLLEGKEKFPFFIDAKNNILSMPPIINSNLTGRVDESTKNLFIECSGFDYEYLSKCINIIVSAFSDMGGDIFSVKTSYKTNSFVSPDFTPEKMVLDLTYINKILGLNLTETKAVSLLKNMGFGFEKNKVLIPAYRADILHQIDLVEDIAIAYGYEHFEEIIPNVATVGQESPLKVFSKKLRDILIGLKLLEVKNYHLINKKELNELMSLDNEIVELKNSLGDHNSLRNSLVSSLLKTLKINQHHEYPQNIFEIGTTFHKDSSMDTGVSEITSLSVCLCDEKTDFTSIKQVLDYVFRCIDVSYEIKEKEHSSFISGRCGTVLINNEEVGIVGEINPQVLENWELNYPVSSFEINISKIFKFVSKGE